MNVRAIINSTASHSIAQAKTFLSNFRVSDGWKLFTVKEIEEDEPDSVIGVDQPLLSQASKKRDTF
jgi:hypothetical protein